jgi:hypothetical protein
MCTLSFYFFVSRSFSCALFPLIQHLQQEVMMLVEVEAPRARVMRKRGPRQQALFFLFFFLPFLSFLFFLFFSFFLFFPFLSFPFLFFSFLFFFFSFFSFLFFLFFLSCYFTLLSSLISSRSFAFAVLMPRFTSLCWINPCHNSLLLGGCNDGRVYIWGR